MFGGHMKNFLAVYMGSATGMSEWNKSDEATRKSRQESGIKAWSDWMAKHQTIIVATGGPLGKTKRVSSTGVADIKNEMTGYVVIKAESHDAAAALFKGHPHFTIFQGEAVEIMEALPIPTR